MDKFYVGCTGDVLNERLRRHNSNHTGFTGGKGDWEIKYVEHFDDKKRALRREKEIKNWKSKTRIQKLIGS